MLDKLLVHSLTPVEMTYKKLWQSVTFSKNIKIDKYEKYNSGVFILKKYWLQKIGESSQKILMFNTRLLKTKKQSNTGHFF